jgi:hypothetical protein
MNRIFEKMLDAKNKFYYGMISRKEFDSILRQCEIEMMACDSL